MSASFPSLTHSYCLFHPRGDQSWVFIGRTDVEAETPILWPPDVKSWLIWKDPDTGKDWGQEEKGTTEDEMVGWHHQLNGHGFQWISGVVDGQGGLAGCGSWGCKELDMTERLNWIELKVSSFNTECKDSYIIYMTYLKFISTIIQMPFTCILCYIMHAVWYLWNIITIDI